VKKCDEEKNDEVVNFAGRRSRLKHKIQFCRGLILSTKASPRI